MTDITKYRNVSLSHHTYEQLQKISKQITPAPGVKLSISKTVESLAAKEMIRLNGKSPKTNAMVQNYAHLPPQNQPISRDGERLRKRAWRRLKGLSETFQTTPEPGSEAFTMWRYGYFLWIPCRRWSNPEMHIFLEFPRIPF